MDVQRVVAAGLEDEIEAGILELELKVAVAVGEEETVERGTGEHGVAVLQARLPVGEDEGGGFRRRGDGGLGFA